MKIKGILSTILLAAVFSASAQDWAKAKLDKSPRRGEWVTVTNGTRAVKCWVVYPETKAKVPAVVLIHEIFGLSDWARNAGDEMAEAGYIAIVPDLLSGMGPDGGGTSAYPTQNAVTGAVQKLPYDQVTGDLNAAADYVKALPQCSGKIQVGGFCWGGTQSFRFACNRSDLSAAYVFYGMPPAATNMARIQCPVYGFYASLPDGGTRASPDTTTNMLHAGKVYEPVIYDGARHGFMRAGEDPGDTTAANKTAHDQAWIRWKELLQKN
jgi:carboxymethylenebutenolidase